MKLQLDKEWFENRIEPDEEFEVGAGVPTDTGECGQDLSDPDQQAATDEEFAETLAFGTLIRLMRLPDFHGNE